MPTLAELPAKMTTILIARGTPPSGVVLGTGEPRIAVTAAALLTMATTAPHLPSPCLHLTLKFLVATASAEAAAVAVVPAGAAAPAIAASLAAAAAAATGEETRLNRKHPGRASHKHKKREQRCSKIQMLPTQKNHLDATVFG